MKKYFPVCLCISLCCFCTRVFGQERKMLLKSWIVTAMYSPDSTRINDTSYLRFTFERNTSYISFSPEWNEMPQDWTVEGEVLRVGMVNYHIDRLTDSSLVISAPGFRTNVMKDEKCLNHDPADLHIVGSFKSEPVYEATRYITPRYKKGNLDLRIREKAGEFSIPKANTFIASFVVATDGTVNEVQVIHGIVADFDKLITKELASTSKEWVPAVFDGKPVNTRVVYTIKYLDSPTGGGL